MPEIWIEKNNRSLIAVNFEVNCSQVIWETLTGPLEISFTALLS